MSTSTAPDEKFLRGLEASKVFTPTAPVDEKSLFAGRRDQIRQVIDAINQKGQHAILYGERGVGKTSLANVISGFLSPNTVVLSPRINCEGRDTFASVIKKAFGEINLITQSRSIGFGNGMQKRPLNALDFLSGDFSSDSVRKALVVLAQNFLPVLIFDEFDRLSPPVKKEFADTVKALSDHAVDATVILVGVADSVSELIEGHQSTERALVQVHMPRMSPAEIKEIITRGAERLNLAVTADALDKVATLSRGLPHYAHLIGLHASRIAIDDGQAQLTVDTVGKAIERALQGSQQSIQSAWHKATMSPRKDNLFADVLLACALAPTDALGFFAARDVREPLRKITGKPYDIPSFSQHLNEFSEEKRGPILQKIGTSRNFRFRFINPLMQPYVVMRGYTDGKLTDWATTAVQ